MQKCLWYNNYKGIMQTPINQPNKGGLKWHVAEFCECTIASQNSCELKDNSKIETIINNMIKITSMLSVLRKFG